MKAEIDYNDAKQLLRMIEFGAQDTFSVFERLLEGFEVKGESIESAIEGLKNLQYLFITFAKAIEKGIAITDSDKLMKFAKEQKLWFTLSDEERRRR